MSIVTSPAYISSHPVHSGSSSCKDCRVRLRCQSRAGSPASAVPSCAFLCGGGGGGDLVAVSGAFGRSM